MILAILSDSKTNDLEKEIETLVSLFENGLEILHIRKKKFSTQEMEKYILAIPAKYHNRIIIHSHYKLALKYDLKGIHLNSKRRKSLRYRFRFYYYKMRKPNLHISTSFNNLSSLFDAGSKFNYVFLSPVFDSISRSGYQGAFNHNNLAIALAKTNQDVLALGGVQLDKVERIKDLGFKGMILSGIIWQSENKLETFRQIQAKCKSI
jgi:thiamine-phosphate pyrophosphorylase